MKTEMQTIEADLLYEWQQYQVTKLVWRKITQDFKPLSALLVCKPEELGRLQGQAEIMEVLKTYFQPKE
jgi:hypothetical protein